MGRGELHLTFLARTLSFPPAPGRPSAEHPIGTHTCRIQLHLTFNLHQESRCSPFC